MSASNAGRIGVWGASGSGKSSYVKQRLKTVKRLIVFDPLDEYAQALRIRRCETANEVLKAARENWNGFRIAYVPPAGKEPRALHQLSLLIFEMQKPFKEKGRGAGLTLVVEEMNLSFPLHGESKARGFADVCSRGRHFGITTYGLSQRIAEVSTRFRGNCTESVVLRQQGPRDIKAATDAIGGNDAQVRALKNLDYLHERNGDISPGRITFK